MEVTLLLICVVSLLSLGVQLIDGPVFAETALVSRIDLLQRGEEMHHEEENAQCRDVCSDYGQSHI